MSVLFGEQEGSKVLQSHVFSLLFPMIPETWAMGSAPLLAASTHCSRRAGCTLIMDDAALMCETRAAGANLTLAHTLAVRKRDAAGLL